MRPNDSTERLFLSLVLQLQQTAWHALGRVPESAAGATERNLDAARYNIDLLGMLEAKTEGRLTDTESRFLREGLARLRLAYVEEKDKARTAAESRGAEAGAAASGARETATAEEEGSSGDAQRN